LKAGILALALLLLLVPHQGLAEVDHRQGEAWTAVRVLYAGGEQLQLNATSNEPIGIIGSWRKSTLTVLLEPHTSNEYNVNALEGIRWWTRAIRVFTALYGHEHLERIEIVTLVNGVNGTSGDITVRFVDDLGGRTCGMTYLNGYGDEITTARISISLRCVGSDMELVRVVSSHEFGHALGLDHTENNMDLMYQYVVRGARPSTLNLYALAVAYSWLRGSTSSIPSSVTLPSSIPYLHLLDVNGLPIRMKLTVLRQIDEGQPVTIRTVLVEAGSEVELVAEGLIYATESEGVRFRFDGWYVSGNKLSGDAKLVLRPRDHMTLLQKYVTQFRVQVFRPVDPLDGWYDRGSRVTVGVRDLIDFGNATRLRLVRWEGPGVLRDGKVEIDVDWPVRAWAVYARQYLIRIRSLDEEKVLWLDEGKVLDYRELVPGTVVSFGNGTRLAPRGFVSDSGAVGSIEVTGPATLEVLWVREYSVRVVRERLGSVSELWAEEGSEVELRADDAIDLGNRTRLSFRGWEGDVVSSSIDVVVKVERPLTVFARYAVQYAVEVRSDVSTFGAVRWADAGAVLRLSVPSVFSHGDGTRYLFIGWSGDVSSEGPEVEVRVDRPLIAVANWIQEHRVVVDLGPLGVMEDWVRDGEMLVLPRELLGESGGRLVLVELGADEVPVTVRGPLEVKPVRITVLERARFFVEGTVEASVVIEAGDSRLEVPKGSVVLLPEGWRAVGVRWKGALQTQAPPDVVPAGDGTYLISLSRRTVRVVVRDPLGLPAPGIGVRVVNEAGSVEGWSTTGWDGVAVLSVVGDVDKRVEVPGGSVNLGPAEDVVTVRTANGFYSLAALALSVLAVPYALLTPRSPPPQRRG
jgi:hypothetical protein